jgi:hypothetical protein
VAGTCECGNELLGSIKWGEFIDQLRTGYFLTLRSGYENSRLWRFFFTAVKDR